MSAPNITGITVRMDKLQALAPNLLPVLSASPVAVTHRDETCFYLVGPAMLESLLAGTSPVVHDLLEPPKGLVELVKQEPKFHQVAEKLLVAETQRVTRGGFQCRVAQHPAQSAQVACVAGARAPAHQPGAGR